MRNFKKSLFLIAFLFCLKTTLLANGIYGFWQTVDKKTHMPTSVIAVYPYNGKVYGKIIANFNDQGLIDETLYEPESRAKGIPGSPYYCGLDFIWLSPSSGREAAKGYIVDPRNGNVYNAKLWIEKGNLILRGELLMFGRNETLYPFPIQTHSAYFQVPDLSTLVPASQY